MALHTSHTHVFDNFFLSNPQCLWVVFVECIVYCVCSMNGWRIPYSDDYTNVYICAQHVHLTPLPRHGSCFHITYGRYATNRGGAQGIASARAQTHPLYIASVKRFRFRSETIYIYNSPAPNSHICIKHTDTTTKRYAHKKLKPLCCCSKVFTQKCDVSYRVCFENGHLCYSIECIQRRALFAVGRGLWPLISMMVGRMRETHMKDDAMFHCARDGSCRSN